MIDLLKSILVEFVEFPDDIEVQETEIGNQTLLTIRSNPQDAGKIVGREGTTINSLRKIARIIGAKRNKKYIVDLAQPD